VTYPTIQAVVDAAAAGQTIELADATYAGDGNRGVTISANRALTIKSASGDPAACIIDAGETTFGFRVISVPAAIVIEGLTIRHGRAINTSGGGIRLQSSTDVTIRNCVLDSCVAENGGGGGLACIVSDPLVVGCLFTGNHSDEDGAAIFSNGGALALGPRVVDCVFDRNTAIGLGGAASLTKSDAEFVNCTMMANEGGAITTCCDGDPSLTLRTITGSTGGPAIEIGGGAPTTASATIDNSVLWDNSGGSVILHPDATATINSSDVDGGWGGPGSGNIDADPQFADGDKRLSVGSPCIDTADLALVPADFADLDGDGNTVEPLPLDLDGNPRVQDGDGDLAAPDMGAYEFTPVVPPCPEDLNDNGSVDFADILSIIAAWGPCVGECPQDLNGNGNVDFADILAVIGAWGTCPS